MTFIYIYFHYIYTCNSNWWNGQSDINIDYEIKRQKAIEQELDCKFIRTDPDKEGFNIFKANNETSWYIKKCLINWPKNTDELNFSEIIKMRV